MQLGQGVSLGAALPIRCLRHVDCALPHGGSIAVVRWIGSLGAALQGLCLFKVRCTPASFDEGQDEPGLKNGRGFLKLVVHQKV